jgi:hypothetical protein
MKQSQMQILRGKIQYHESRLDAAYFQKDALAKKLKTCGIRERARIEREIAALQTQIDYYFRQYSDAESEKFAIECQRVPR